MDRPSRMSASIPAISSVLAGVLLLGLGTFPGWAQQAAPPAAQDTPTARQDNPPAQTDDQRLMRGLDEQVQEIKSEVLSISQELTRLEEKLLFPSGTQVAVFVELAPGATLRLDAVRLSIDGQLVTHYIYSAKELEALRKGGVQRVYVGNVATGSHQIEVLVDGKLASGADFTHTDRFGFRKEVKPKLLGLTLAGPDSDTSAITLAEWLSMRPRHTLLGLGVALALAPRPAAGAELRDPFFGEALYHAHQGQFFDALQRLDAELAQYHGLDEPVLDTLHFHVHDAEFSVGDFELSYRMHHRAGRAIKAVLEGAVDEAVRNEAAYRLARIHFQKGQLDDARHALDRIQGTVPPDLTDDIEFLRGSIAMATGRPGEAVEVLAALRTGADLAGFAAYNLGIALLQDGRTAEALEQLDRSGRLAATDRAGLAVRDKSNLVLGSLLFETGDFTRARQALDRVHLEGLFSNQALLRAGWAEATAGQHDRALVPWNILAGREPTDAAVQEAMLAVPHAYASLELHGRAALLYGRALELYSGQIARVDASIASILEGQFLEALVREESRQDRDWVIHLRSLPDAPETYYLMELLASHDFQTALRNYLDLEDLRARLAAWRASLDAFQDMIRLRSAHYEPLLPGVDAEFRELDARMRLRLEQQKNVGKRLEAMLTAPRPDHLATAEERIAHERILELEERVGDADGSGAEALRLRAARLRGALTWRLETEYHQRLTDAHAHLRELDAHVEEMNRRYEAFVRTRQAASHSYVGYDTLMERLRRRVGDAHERVGMLMARQGHLIETVAINRLRARRERLVDQQTQARFAVADSYDRAAQARAVVEETR